MSTGKSLAMMPFFPADYIAATRHMSLAERGAYTDLLFFQWENERLPSEPDRLARLIGCTPEEFAVIWPHIRGKFAEMDGSLANQRLEEHRAESLRLRAIRVQIAEDTNAKRSARRSAQRNADRDGERDGDRPLQGTLGAALSVTPSATLTGTSPSPSPSPNPSPSNKGNGGLPGRKFHQEIVAAYHEILATQPRVKEWTKKRASLLSARIAERCKAGKPADGIEYWREYFAQVAASDFLMGRTSANFKANLEWLVRPENFLKVIEGNYVNRRSNGGHAHGG